MRWFEKLDITTNPIERPKLARLSGGRFYAHELSNGLGAKEARQEHFQLDLREVQQWAREQLRDSDKTENKEVGHIPDDNDYDDWKRVMDEYTTRDPTRVRPWIALQLERLDLTILFPNPCYARLGQICDATDWQIDTPSGVGRVVLKAGFYFFFVCIERSFGQSGERSLSARTSWTQWISISQGAADASI